MANCYISQSTGNDGNAGTEGSPKATLAACIGVIGNGDTVFLKRGDTWTGEKLTLAGGPVPSQESERITFDAYGSGANPIVSPQHNATIVVTTVGAYEAGSDQTPITASGGGFTGRTGQTLYFPAENNGSLIKGGGLTDTFAYIVGDFSGASTQTCKIYTTSENFVNLASRDYVTVQNIDFTDGSSIPLGNGPGMKLKNCTLSAMRFANGNHIECTATDAASEISGNTMSDGVRCASAISVIGAQNMAVYNNTITDIDGDAIIAHDSNTVSIYGNECGDVARARVGSEGHGDAIVVTGSADCSVYNNLIYDYTQGIYVGANAEQSSTTGLRIWGNRGYVTNGWGGGTMPFVMIDVGFNAGANKSSADLEVFGNTCGDLGGAQPCVVLKTTSGQGTGEITSVKARNNVFWTDRASPGPAFSIGAAVTSYDIDYNRYGGWTAVGDDDANSVAGVANPFVDYDGYAATAFDFHITAVSVCNNTGDPALTTSVTVPSTYTDPDGVTRTKNSGDIGAYEQAGASATGGPFDVAAGQAYVPGATAAGLYMPAVSAWEVNS